MFASGCTSAGSPPSGTQPSQPTGSPSDPGPRNLEPVEYLVPTTANIPSEFSEIAPVCAEPFDDDKRTWYSIAVPSNWIVDAKIGGGTGSPISDGVELRFSTGAGHAAVNIQPDIIRPDGAIGDGADKEWKSFDYQSDTYNTAGASSGKVSFTRANSVTVADQLVDIFEAPRGLYPTYRDASQYKARIKTMITPRMQGGEIQQITTSVVVTVTPGQKVGQLPSDVVAGIIGSFALPECTRERVGIYQEMLLNSDLNGDGTIATAADLREALASGDANAQ